jgi:hypothetical protein
MALNPRGRALFNRSVHGDPGNGDSGVEPIKHLQVRQYTAAVAAELDHPSPDGAIPRTDRYNKQHRTVANDPGLRPITVRMGHAER